MPISYETRRSFGNIYHVEVKSPQDKIKYCPLGLALFTVYLIHWPIPDGLFYYPVKKKPTYYVNIPAQVRLDNNLSFGARLLYGDIAALCSKTGKCWANNKYFAEQYQVSTRQVQNWLVELSGGKNKEKPLHKYIEIQHGKHRVITIVV